MFFDFAEVVQGVGLAALHSGGSWFIGGGGDLDFPVLAFEINHPFELLVEGSRGCWEPVPLGFAFFSPADAVYSVLMFVEWDYEIEA